MDYQEVLSRFTYDDGTDKELAADTEKYEMWIETFCSQVPDKEIRKQIK